MAAEMALRADATVPLPRRHGRNALYVHGLALVFAVITAIAGLAMDWNKDDVFPVLAVNATAALILGAWALLLAWPCAAGRAPIRCWRWGWSCCWRLRRR